MDVIWDDRFEELVRRSLPFLPPSEELRADTDLTDAGLDSLGIVELLTSLEQAYGVRFAEDALTRETFGTPATLWRALSG
ncbi:acyl carrier protein [Nonomuraea muscovyensis]|jgi:acyl carrier protein|uniref:Acyl carrier protein n=1 Tax=Nonomuraea muscovyensis TaxID=1124761 RepID=A0A7X0CC68_9ACTN|nr:acyl carrier protein [Nonomuraea muscovyensis]MBB6351436.1 acyl carrier protein [Nonomuraea muscovyensis]MDF2706545.1 phosphopantetheine-binding protein [Nonomuraea muscovyensis]